jgi:hypothetical protein
MVSGTDINAGNRNIGKLTRSSLWYLLCRDSENIQYFHHYLNDDVRHRRGWWNLHVSLQTFEKVLDPHKDVDQGLLRCTDILSRLTRFEVKLGLRRDMDRIPTWRRTPAPAKIAVAGENTYIVTVKLWPYNEST